MIKHDLFFPDVAAYVEPSSVEFLKDEVFTDVTEGECHRADLVAKARFRGHDTTFMIHIEAQGQRQDHFPSRMFTYFARFHERHKLPIYPIAIFSYTSPLKEQAQLVRLPAQFQPHRQRVDGTNAHQEKGPRAGEDGMLAPFGNLQLEPG